MELIFFCILLVIAVITGAVLGIVNGCRMHTRRKTFSKSETIEEIFFNER